MVPGAEAPGQKRERKERSVVSDTKHVIFNALIVSLISANSFFVSVVIKKGCVICLFPVSFVYNCVLFQRIYLKVLNNLPTHKEFCQ